MFIVLITKSYDKSVWCNFSVHCLKYFLGRISSNRVKEMQAELLRAFDRVPYPSVKTIIFNNSGFNIEDI